MRGIPSTYLLFFFAIVFLVELVSYFGMRRLLLKYGLGVRLIYTIVYSCIFIGTSSLLFYSFSNPELIRQSQNYTLFYLVIVVSVLNLIPKFYFSLMTLLSFLIRIVSNRLQMILLSGGLILSISIFTVILYGLFINRYQLVVKTVNLYFDNLPPQFEGFRVVQLSDIHFGTFNHDTRVIRKAVSATNELHPDLLLFTGDIVNNFSEEMVGYEDYLSQFSARYGKFAILGNHDYGDYYHWTDSLAKKKNLALIKDGMIKSGFELLLNQSTKISVKDTSVTLIGVENWGQKPFPQYADLNKAMQHVPDKSFKILMTHDPSHWEAIVVPQTDIPLTLSGHTHGGQFGIKIAGIEFSPIYLIQRCWGGLYKSDNQYLYVNTGLGSIGFAGRIEMTPEITLLILHRTKNH